jgi:hypothetical protein
MKGLFLDDSRNPIECTWIDFDYTPHTWIIVRNYESFIDILQHEKFDIVSFDHDLDRTSTYECIRSNTNKAKFDYSKVREKTGLDCAKFFKEFYEKSDKKRPKYLVHSLNEQGRENIIDILGRDDLLAEYCSTIFFNKSDEILQKRASWSK